MARDFIAFDLETTGMDPHRDEIIEVGGVRFDEFGTVLGELDLLVKPKGEVPEAVLRLTGISRSELEQASTWEEIKERVQEFIGDSPLVGHSIGFDTGFLRAKGITLSPEWYDTWYLSSALFADPEIYSLEALAQYFGIQLDNAHRALADCHASRELFLYCCRALSDLDPGVLEELTLLGQRSPYPIDRLGKSLPRGIEIPTSAQRAEAPRKGQTQDLSEFLANSAGAKSCRLQLVRPEVDILASTSQSLARSAQMVIAVPNSDERDVLAAELSESGVAAELLLQPADVLSVARASVFLAQKSFSLVESVFASKLLIWRARSTTGFRDELALGGEDFDLWRELSCAGLGEEELRTEKYWSAYRAKAEGATALLCSFRSLARVELPPGVPLLILNWQVFEEQMTQYLSDNLSSWSRVDEAEASRDRLDIIWGLLGMLAAKYIKDFGESSLPVTTTITGTPEWRQISQALDNLEGGKSGDRRTHWRVERLRTILKSDLKEWIVWIQADQGGASVHRAPVGIEGFVTGLGEGRAMRLIGTDATRAPKECEVVQARLDEEQRVSTKVLTDGPGANSPQLVGYVREVVLKLLESSPQLRIFIAFSSKTAAGDFAQSCGGELVGRPLIGDGVTGSLNRTKLLLRQDPSAIVLGSPRTNREHIFPQQFDAVVVPKLSFDVPSDPVHLVRGKRYGGFQGYSLPRVAGKVRQLVSKLDPAGQKSLILCDARLTSSDWGKLLLSRLDLDSRSVGVPELATVVEPGDS